MIDKNSSIPECFWGCVIVAIVYIFCFSSLSFAGHLVFIGLILFLGIYAGRGIYNSTTHVRFAKGKESLRRDARIIQEKHEKIPSSYDPRFRTTIEFDDGFCFISHQCTVIRLSNDKWGNAYLSDEEKEVIRDEAIQVHADMVTMYNKE